VHIRLPERKSSPHLYQSQVQAACVLIMLSALIYCLGFEHKHSAQIDLARGETHWRVTQIMCRAHGGSPGAYPWLNSPVTSAALNISEYYTRRSFGGGGSGLSFYRRSQWMFASQGSSIAERFHAVAFCVHWLSKPIPSRNLISVIFWNHVVALWFGAGKKIAETKTLFGLDFR
jgi:hypothetical protein